MASANDSAWNNYIEATKIKLDGSSYKVNAKELKRITGREPRLLAKIDDPEHVPNILAAAKYSLLAITNGSYLLFKGTIFATVPVCQTRAVYNPQLDFPLDTTGRGTGEAEYLDHAFNTGLISEFADSGRLYMTIRGRERTKQFKFLVSASNMEIAVDRVQIEVDAGYESDKDILIVEGKIGDRNHFNIRQLYYPFRHFSQLVPHKKVRAIFFAYNMSKATYSLYEFGFENPDVFDSIHPIKCCVYSLTRPQTYAIDELVDKNLETENNIVPQADDLNKILELLTLINSGQNTVTDVADYFVFDERQSNYYGEAAEFLGLITRNRGIFELTERGNQFIATAPKNQQLFITKLVVNTWFFKELLRRAKRKGSFTKLDVENLISDVSLDDGSKRYSQSTIGRRTSTIMAWVRWIGEEMKAFVLEDNKVILK